MSKLKITVQGPEKKEASPASAPAKKTRHIAVTKVSDQPAKKSPAKAKTTKKITVKSTPKPATKKSIKPAKSIKVSTKSPTEKPAQKKVIKKTAPKPIIKVAPKVAPKTAPKIVKPAPKPVATPRPISSASTHRSIIQRSTTLSRRYVKRPTMRIANGVKIVEVSASDARKEQRQALKKARAQKLANLRLHKNAQKPSETLLRSASKNIKSKEAPRVIRQSIKRKHRGRRIALAVICSLLVIGGLGAFFYFNMPDISVKVAAMQTGIEASYPSFTPRGYSLSSVTSDKDGIVTIYFDNNDGGSFTLTEENSTWDSNALLNNYVKKNFPSDYATIREQGITIYYRGGNSAWVNGGILYKINCTGGALTKEQVRNIATSM